MNIRCSACTIALAIAATAVVATTASEVLGQSRLDMTQAALDTDIPDGGTIQGYGVKFYPPGHELAGQNMRSYPVMMQHLDAGAKVVWPARLRTAEPVFPWPKSHSYSNQ